MKINVDIKVFVLGNKSDLSLLRQVDYEDAKRKAEKLKVKLYETSALDSKNIVFDIGHFESEILILEVFKEILGIDVTFAKENSPFIY